MKWTLLCMFAIQSIASSGQRIVTVAGNGTRGYSGDGGAATLAGFSFPGGVALDNKGNLFLTDSETVRKVGPSGIISRYAGIGTNGYSGDGGPATNAQFFDPAALATDNVGNLYVAENYNLVVRKIDTSGMISTFAGGGFDNRDSIPATNANFLGPINIAIDKEYLYILDQGYSWIRKVNLTTGLIYYVYTGSIINFICGLGADGHGNVYYTAVGDYRVYKIDSLGTNTCVAGNGTFGVAGDGGPATACQLYCPTEMVVDTFGRIYLSDCNNPTIRRVDTDGIITTYAGNGTFGFSGDGGPATAASMAYESGQNGGGFMAVDTAGNLYIEDGYNLRIRKIYYPNTTFVQQNTPNNNFKISPNPTDKELYITYHFTNNQDGVIQITDLAGRVVVARPLNAQKKQDEVDVGSLSPGLYLYRVTQNNELVSSGKLVKE